MKEDPLNRASSHIDGDTDLYIIKELFNLIKQENSEMLGQVTFDKVESLVSQTLLHKNILSSFSVNKKLYPYIFASLKMT